MLKNITTLTLATGSTVLAFSLFAESPTIVEEKSNQASDVAKVAPPAPTTPTMDNNKPVAITAPAAPSKSFTHTEKAGNPNVSMDISSKSNTSKATEVTAPTGLFISQEVVTKPSAPKQPTLSEDIKSGAKNAAPAEPIPVAPGMVSMGVAPQVEPSEKTETNASVVTSAPAGSATKNPLIVNQENQQSQKPIAPTIEVPVKPEAPKAMEKPVDMTAPQQKDPTTVSAGGSNTHTNTSSMKMPSMNMNMPTINMNTPSTTVDTSVSPKTPEPATPVTAQPVE